MVMTKSNDWSILLGQAKALGCEPDEVNAFLEFIDAPPNLACLKSVLQNGSRLLNKLSEFASLQTEYSALFLPEQLSSWQWVLRVMVESDDSNFEEIKDYSKKVPLGEKLPRKYLGSHPLYALLCRSAPVELESKFLTCQALSVLVDVRLRSAEDEGTSDFSELRYKFLLDVRKLAERVNGRELLALFPEHPLSLVDYVEKLEALDENEEILVSILARLNREKKNLLPMKKRSAQRSTTASGHVSAEQERWLGEGDTGQAAFRVAGVPSLSRDVIDQFRRDVGHKDEQETGHSLITAVFDGRAETDDGSTSRQRAHAARGFRNRIAILNQQLPSQKPGLSSWETATLISFIYPPQDCEQCQQSNFSPEVCLALGLMLWCSIDLQDLANFKFYSEDYYNEQSTVEKPISPGLLSGRGGNLYVVVRPATASIKKKHRVDAELSDHVLLPLPIIMSRLWSLYKPKRIVSNKPLFGREKPEIREKVTEALFFLRNRESGDYTDSRLSRHLFHIGLNQQGSDITLPMYWSGKNHYLGRVVSHYTRAESGKLCEHYAKTCLELMQQVRGDLAHMGWGQSPHLLCVSSQARREQSGAVGSPFCPEVKVLKSVFSKAYLEVNRNRPVRQSQKLPQELYKIHNPLTLYTALGLSLASGARAIGKAIKVPSSFHTESGFAIINEKSTVDYFNSRLIWLPPTILEQYQNYLEHLNNIYLWLYIVDREKALALKAALKGGVVAGDMFGSWLFMLDEENRVRPLDTADIVKRLADYGFVFKGNALRHLVRTRAVAQGIPSEIINAQLGHWDNGQAPWEKWSFLTTKKLKHKLSPLFEVMLDDVNFKPIKGVGSTREYHDELGVVENSQIAEQINLFE